VQPDADFTLQVLRSHLGFRKVAAERRLRLRFLQRPLAAGDHERGDAIADQIGRRQRLRQQAMYGENVRSCSRLQNEHCL
jgi:hypothetical protein